MKIKTMINFVPIKYRKIHLTTFQWYSFGWCMYWQTLLTEKVRSTRVMMAYCRAPTMNLYNLGSSNVDEPSWVNLRDDIIWVGWELAHAYWHVGVTCRCILFVTNIISQLLNNYINYFILILIRVTKSYTIIYNLCDYILILKVLCIFYKV